MVTTGNPDGSLTTEARTGTVSIIVSYRPQQYPHLFQLPKPNNDESPPSYDSLFTRAIEVEDGEETRQEEDEERPPPNYNAVASVEAEASNEEEEEDASPSSPVPLLSPSLEEPRGAETSNGEEQGEEDANSRN